MEVRQLKRDLVTIKGSANGIHLEIIGDDYSQILGEIDDKINTSSKFFKGAKFNGIISDKLSNDKILEIKLILKYKYEFDIDLDLANNHNFYKTSDREDLKELDQGMTKFIYGTLRSGQVVEFYGNIVVIGDVNPGAFLKAGGNIVVLGTLKGVAQAGGHDNVEAIVAAYSLLPTQLKIGNIISRPPDDYSGYDLPEIARVSDGELFIEPYLPSK